MAGNGVIFARGGSNQSQAFQPQPRPEPVLNQATAPFFGVRNAAPSATTSTHQFDASVGIAPTAFADVRATVATYTDDDGFVRTAAANTERIDYDPTSKALLGLYIEPSGTNRAPNSETFTQGGGAPQWLVDVPGPTLTNTTILDPRGTKTGQTVNLGTTSASGGGVYINITAQPAGSTFIFSSWVKSSISSGASFFRFTYNNTIGWTGGSGSTRFTPTSAWTRFSFTGTVPSNGNINIGYDNRDSTGTWDSTCTGSIDIWGPQLEIASSASSYIRTTSSASVTRAADSYSFTLGASQTSIQFTFDDGSTQTVSGLTGGATYTIPTNLNRARILYWDDPAALASSGTAAGDNTATAVGAWLQEGVGSSAGANTTTAVAAPIQSEPGTSAGTDTATGAGAWLQSGVGSSAGSNTSTATSAWLQSGVGSSAGSNTALGNKLVVTLNPSDKNTNIVLSNGNLTASLTASIGALTGVDVRATDTFASGYWEVTFTTLVTGQAHGVGIGFSNSSQVLDHYPQGPNSVGYFNNGFVAKVSGSTTVTGFAQGDVVGAWLVGDGSLQYFVNGVNVYTDTSLPTGNLYPIVCLANDTESGTVNFGATAMSYLPPGVSSWDRSRIGSTSGAGTSSGANTASGIGAWLQSGVGSSAGTNTTTLVGSWLQSGVGNAAGSNTTSGYAAAVPNVGTSAGANTSTAVGRWLQPSVGSSAGTDTATAVGAWLQSGVGSSAGTNTAAAVSSLAGVTWNPSDKSVDVTLSGGNLTATRSSTSTGVNDVQARANTGRTSGGYFEIVFSTVVGGAHNPGIGLGNLSQSVNDYPGHTANSIGWFANGFFRGPTGVQSAPTFVVGDVIGCELTASSAKFYKNGTLVVTESSLPTGTLYPIISVASVTDAGTANFGATAMAYLPTGVVSWDGSRTGAVTNVGTAAGSNTSTAVGAWIKASVGSAVGGNVASAVSSEADFNTDFDHSFAGFPGAETGLGTGDFNNDFNNDYAVFHVGTIVSGVGASVGGNIAAAVSSTEAYVPPVTPPPPVVGPQVWYPAREYTRVQAPRAVRTYRTGTELKRSTPQGMKRRYG
jgi:hypothetical protein